jgi:NAD(P)-dependent dehydrogenase (short-subunit alcohol dehydrogenase family)
LKFSTVITPALKRVFGESAINATEKYHAMMNPAGRICTVEEVAGVVSLLAGPKASWFNGATIDFTGGTTIKMAEVIFGFMAREGEKSGNNKID